MAYARTLPLLGFSMLAACGGGDSGTSTASGSGGGGTTGSTTSTTSTTSSVASVGSGGAGGGVIAACDPPAAPGSLYERTAETFATFEQTSMCQYRGDVLLIVNIAAA